MPTQCGGLWDRLNGIGHSLFGGVVVCKHGIDACGNGGAGTVSRYWSVVGHLQGWTAVRPGMCGPHLRSRLMCSTAMPCLRDRLTTGSEVGSQMQLHPPPLGLVPCQSR